MKNDEKQMARVREAVKALDDYVSASEKPVGVATTVNEMTDFTMLRNAVEYSMELLWRQFSKVKK